ncbi:amidohydrolase [Halioglobus japonicus]|uniref:Amidohydrolase n=1 Tax=Halioglobus japonicus TaxID=930805 RepID=A0AAP8SNR0_9GAMM|nr:amidohydrolase [Halioglobus japonicus]AQA18731.1 amidohydrolase [Halioglobus japonicus]PLW86759.1 amidohydrolase [Halioglobus japonicus]GHD11210.1 amidohydrolase [Halioglobus japonicus]
MPLIKLLLATLLAVTSTTAAATTLIHNIEGYSLENGELIRFSALEFDGSKITARYPTDEAAAQSSATTKLDGNGATMLPGLIDAHGHIAGYGQALASVNLFGTSSEAEAAQRVARFAAQSKEPWIQGGGWNQVLWDVREFPTRATLDAIDTDRPIALRRIDGHALWVNSTALEMAGIHAETVDPDGGQIIRGPDGKPTGVLIDNAMDAVYRAIPSQTQNDIAESQRQALLSAASFGLTSVHDAGVSAAEVSALQRLHSNNTLPLRVYAMLDVLDPGNDATLASGPQIDPNHRLDIRSVKISADGALGSRGAALAEDYSDKPGHKGLLLLSDEDLVLHMSRAMAAGYQVNTHAIGDLANTRVLDLYETLIAKEDSAGLRHRIEHAQILQVEDIPRFAQLGVIASIQPTHATSDMNMAGDRLGEDRLVGAYAWKSLLDDGAQVAGGSDFPVEHPNPFYGLYSAITRQDQAGGPPGGWLPGQKISRAEALSLFTEGAAFAAHQESAIGRLAPGYFADFILVRENYFEMPESAIWNSTVLETWVAGEPVYVRPE